jgi:hypothetical protein
VVRAPGVEPKSSIQAGRLVHGINPRRELKPAQIPFRARRDRKRLKARQAFIGSGSSYQGLQNVGIAEMD